MLWNPVQGAFAPLLLALVALAAVMGFAHRIAGRRAALLAGAIFFAQPFMVWETTSVFIESGIALAVALAGWNAFRFVRRSERSGLVLVGVFAGGAAGMKYLGLFAALTIPAGPGGDPRRTRATPAGARIRRAGPRRRAAVVREEHRPDREPVLSASLRRPQRLCRRGTDEHDADVRARSRRPRLGAPAGQAARRREAVRRRPVPLAALLALRAARALPARTARGRPRAGAVSSCTSFSGSSRRSRRAFSCR